MRIWFCLAALCLPLSALAGPCEDGEARRWRETAESYHKLSQDLLYRWGRQKEEYQRQLKSFEEFLDSRKKQLEQADRQIEQEKRAQREAEQAREKLENLFEEMEKEYRNYRQAVESLPRP